MSVNACVESWRLDDVMVTCNTQKNRCELETAYILSHRMSALLPSRVLGTARCLSSHQHANAVSGRAWPFRNLMYTHAPVRANSMQAYQRMHTTRIERMKMESGTGDRDWSNDNDPTNGTVRYFGASPMYSN